MADYSSSGGRFGGFGKERTGFRFQSWSTDDDGGKTTRERWESSSWLSSQEPRRDHVCRPVVIGSDGKASPVMLDYPPHHHKDHSVTDNGWNKSGDTHRSDAYEAQAFVSNVQTAASNGNRLGFPGGMFQLPKAQYGAYDDDTYYKSSSAWSRPVAAAEPATFNTGGWGAPAQGKLSRATNDIGTAAEFLRDSARPAPAPAPMAGPGPRGLQSSQAYQTTKKSSSTTIDSREAAKKYGGQFIW
ncbi:unnamed protein product [Musa hybrid cultivar]